MIEVLKFHGSIKTVSAELVEARPSVMHVGCSLGTCFDRLSTNVNLTHHF